MSISGLQNQVIAFIRASGVPAWLVGGYVRDRLLGRPTHDMDVVVTEGAIRLARALARQFDGASFVLDEERDMARAILRDEGDQPLDVDVARLRVAELPGDLALRDFTINAMAVDIAVALATPGQEDVWSQVIDPFDGRGDLAAGLVRAVGEGAFRDDPLRLLRAVRHAAELGFQIEAATAVLIRRDAWRLPAVAAERCRDELIRILAAPRAWHHVRELKALDLLRYVLPETAAQVGVTQSPPHYQDVFDHTLSTMAHLEGICALLWPEAGYVRPGPDPENGTFFASLQQWDELARTLQPYVDDLRAHFSQILAADHTRRVWLPWAALAHDWGKPAMRSVTADGRIRFLGHEHWGALLVDRRGQALRLASAEIAYLAQMVNLHMRPGFLAHEYPPTLRAVYRFFRDAGTTGPDCALLSLADHMAYRAPSPDPTRWQQRLGTTRMLLDVFFRQRAERIEPAPLLDGRQLMIAFGLEPGPQVGELLEGLREAQAVGEVSTPEQALAWVAARIKGDR